MVRDGEKKPPWNAIIGTCSALQIVRCARFWGPFPSGGWRGVKKITSALAVNGPCRSLSRIRSFAHSRTNPLTDCALAVIQENHASPLRGKKVGGAGGNGRTSRRASMGAGNEGE